VHEAEVEVLEIFDQS